jgi:hypothetical protein
MHSTFFLRALSFSLFLLALAQAGCSLPRGSITPGDLDGGDMDGGGGDRDSAVDVGTGRDAGPDGSVLPDSGADGGPMCTAGGCDDGNACTDDVCVPATGCRHDPNTSSCDDGVLCNGGDTCAAGGCTAHDGVDPCPGSSTCDVASDSCMGCEGPSDCPMPMTSDWSACGFPSGDVCATGGTRSRDVTSYTCTAAGVCEASTTPETEACSRATDGTMCAGTMTTDWSACDYADACSEAATMTRDVTTSTCVSGSCTAVTSPESAGCTRDTDGTSCGAVSAGSYGPCIVGASCSTSGMESRMVMTPTCTAGACGDVTTTESRACTLPGSTDGTPCGTPTCGAYGPCIPNTAMMCETAGMHSRTCMSPICAGGSCSGSSGMPETEACVVPSGGACSTRACTPCLESGMTRCRAGHSGTRMCTQTTGTCDGSGACAGSGVTTSEGCSCPP